MEACIKLMGQLSLQAHNLWQQQSCCCTLKTVDGSMHQMDGTAFFAGVQLSAAK
jgi:hypothetical protein